VRYTALPLTIVLPVSFLTSCCIAPFRSPTNIASSVSSMFALDVNTPVSVPPPAFIFASVIILPVVVSISPPNVFIKPFV